MIEVYPKLFVGSDVDFSSARTAGFYIVQAAKEPWHRDALGYTGRAAPLSNPERFVARRHCRLILNMIDADDPKYFSDVFFSSSFDFITESLKIGKVLVHCNQGLSRAPSIALAWLATQGKVSDQFFVALADFRKVYPLYAPKAGVFAFLKSNWSTFFKT